MYMLALQFQYIKQYYTYIVHTYIVHTYIVRNDVCF